MPFFPPDFLFKTSSNSQSWLSRVSENLRALRSTWSSPLHSVGGMPVPFSTIDPSTRYGPAQAFSAFTHLAICAAFLLLLTSGRGQVRRLQPIPLGGHDLAPIFSPPPNMDSLSKPSLGRRGGSGDNDPAPATKGALPPPSSMPLAPPRLVHNENVDLPVAPAVFDPNAPASVPTITHLGLPWMDKENDSPGPGKGHGIGSSDGDGIGDVSGNGEGVGDDGGNYANMASPPACQFCPEPPYTEEARRAKLQGKITVQVLVGQDGRAKRIRILKGLGMGLDEKAIEAIRTWHFVPAKDARRQPISVWVTIETHFQLL